jgi:hypothetical protein
MPDYQVDPKRINASPTKEFFIYMLVRDIPLNRAVIDLVDNSVDGAKRIREGAGFDGLWIRIEVKPDHFRIADNCGGIPVDVARDYAFRFGRPKDAPAIAGSIGQFGVGMKRTFFKLGRFLCVESTSANSYFTMEIDTEEWKSRQSGERDEDWHFEFKKLEEGISVPPEKQGTIIEIAGLHTSVAESFGQEPFISRLAQEIAVAHAMSMDNGLSITVNEIPLRHDPLELLSSDLVKPAHLELLYDKVGPKPVRVKLYAGIAGRSKEEGGWYVFCNGRMVLRADQTNLTVWAEGDRVPKYHPDFARFRGLAYFDSDDASLLPWTTTKTGVDADSPVYRAARQQMIEMTRPVLDFLRKIEDERKKHEDGDIPDNPLARALAGTEAAVIKNIEQREVFLRPEPPPPPPGPIMQRIQYSKPADDVDKAKKLLHVSSFKEVGEMTFDYFMNYEGGHNGE